MIWVIWKRALVLGVLDEQDKDAMLIVQIMLRKGTARNKAVYRPSETAAFRGSSNGRRHLLDLSDIS